jgi:hypothetical protein
MGYDKFKVISYQSVHQYISSSDIMSSKPGVRFHNPPITECTSMDVDESSESWMSLGMCCFCDFFQLTGHVLDALDDIYLGPDGELDSDSGSSGGPDALNATSGMFLNSNVHILHVQIHHILPDPSHPVQADEFALYDSPDLYLGPEDDLIDADDPPAVPDSPMTGECILPFSCSFFMAFPKWMNRLLNHIRPVWLYQWHP